MRYLKAVDNITYLVVSVKDMRLDLISVRALMLG